MRTDTSGAHGARAPSVVLLSWKPIRKGSLLGFAAVRLDRTLIVHDVPVPTGKSGPWVGTPSKPQIGPDGTARRSGDGKALYSPVLEWADKEAARRFGDAVLDALQREHPGALDPDERRGAGAGR